MPNRHFLRRLFFTFLLSQFLVFVSLVPQLVVIALFMSIGYNSNIDKTVKEIEDKIWQRLIMIGRRRSKKNIRNRYYRELYKKVNEEYQTHEIFPPSDEIFSAFHLTPLKDVKVVILGQDPYHNNGQAHGLSFSVKPG